jgi:hypothetical protein
VTKAQLETACLDLVPWVQPEGRAEWHAYCAGLGRGVGDVRRYTAMIALAQRARARTHAGRAAGPPAAPPGPAAPANAAAGGCCGGPAPAKAPPPRSTEPPEGQARPGPLARAARFAAALAKYVAAGLPRAPEAVAAARLAACSACPNLDPDDRVCRLCGCYVDIKTQWATEACPDRPPRWDAHP